MASESGEQDVVGEGLSDELDAWLRQRADDLDVSREELLAQLAGSYRLAVESNGDAGAALGADADAAGLDDLDDRIERAVAEATEERIGRLEQRVGGRIEELEAEFDAKIDEIRKRVVQLKADLDSAAPADHDHEAFERVEELAAEVEDLEESVASLREAGGSGDAGSVAELEEKVTTVASAVVDLREADRGDGSERTRRAALQELKRQAGQAGVETADCGACGSEVNLALLTEPACPQCETELRDLSVSSGFLFDSATVGSGAGEETPGGES